MGLKVNAYAMTVLHLENELLFQGLEIEDDLWLGNPASDSSWAKYILYSRLLSNLPA